MSEFTVEPTAIRDMTRTFVAREVRPHALTWDAEARVPGATAAMAGRLGLFGIAMPPE